jgi:hypothetical protein
MGATDDYIRRLLAEIDELKATIATLERIAAEPVDDDWTPGREGRETVRADAERSSR